MGQKSVAFIFNPKMASKIKNKIARLRMKISCFSFENAVVDALSRVCRSTACRDDLKLHKELCYLGMTRMLHIVRIRNLPFLVEDVKWTVKTCQIQA